MEKLSIVSLAVGIAAIVISAVTLASVASFNVSIQALNTSVAALQAHEQETTEEVSAPGVKANEYYIFTQELNANETALGVPVAVFTLTQIVTHKGDEVTIHFYNTAESPDDRHTFTMQSPYKMNYDLAGGENTTIKFKADTVGKFTYYCTYDLPSMVGQLEVLP